MEKYLSSIEARLKKYLHENQKDIKWILISSFLTGWLSYHIFAMDGYGHQDSICEGFYYYAITKRKFFLLLHQNF